MTSFNDEFDIVDAGQCVIGSGTVAIMIYIENLLVPVLWRSIALLLAITGFLILVNLNIRKSTLHIIQALIFIAVFVGAMGLFLERDFDTIGIAIVGGFIGGLSMDALLGKGRR